MKKSSKKSKKPKSLFFYVSRYQSTSEKLAKRWDYLKFVVFQFLQRNQNFQKCFGMLWEYYPFGDQIISDFEVYRVRVKRKKNREGVWKEEKLTGQNDSFNCNNFKVDELHLFEVINIDEFQKYERRIIAGYKKAFLQDEKRKLELRERLSSVKNNLGSISYGGTLYYRDFSKERTKHNDLIDSCTLSPTKTKESFYILGISVTPSKKFHKLFGKIVDQDISDHIDKINMNSFSLIIRNRRFISSWSSLSLKRHNMDLLYRDLHAQVRKNVTSTINGRFHSNKNGFLPSISFYEVDKLKNFQDDRELFDTIKNYSFNFYKPDDREVLVFLPDFNEDRNPSLSVVQEENCWSDEKNKNEKTNYDSIYKYCLRQSLTVPYVLRNILIQESNELDSLRRRIYDFVYDARDTNFLGRFLLLLSNSKYLRLKESLTYILMIVKRFESEFRQKEFRLFMRDADLSEYKIQGSYIHPYEEKDLYNRLLKGISFQLKSINERAKSISEIFKSIEELHAYRTNYILQITSLFIGILAFFFAFEEIKNYFLKIVEVFWG